MNHQTRIRALAAGLCLSMAAVTAIAVLTVNRSSPEPISLAEASKLSLPHVRSAHSPKNQGDDARARYEWELMRLRDPSTGQLPPDVRARELAFARELPRAEFVAGKTGQATAENWSFLGPVNVGGRTRALAIDLDYDGSANRRILAGGISGGMYLSEDDGATWTLATGLSEMASVTCLAQDPTSRNIWYYGTGEFTGNSAGGPMQIFYGHGLFKSTDGGRTWSQLLSTRDGKPTSFDNTWDYVWNVRVHPTGGAVFAATYGAIYRSFDGGSTWEYNLGRQSQNDPWNVITDVAIAVDGDVYGALSRNGSGTGTYGVFKSANRGDQWAEITPPGLANDPYRMVLAASPSDANTLYLLVQVNQEGAVASHHQLFRYNDAAGTWTDLSGGIPDEQGAEGNASFSTQGGYDQIVYVKPDNPDVVFIGGTNLYRSTDGGVSFQRIGGYSSPANYGQFDNHHSDQHSMAFLPTNPSIAISGHDGGLSKSSNILAQPHSWTSLNNGYVTTQYYTIAIDPQPGGLTVVGGLQDNGTWGTQSDDGLSEWFKLFGGDGAHAAVTPGAGFIYASSQSGNVFRLTTNSYAMITPAGAQQFMFINPFVLDPTDSRVMYMGEAGGVWRNSNLEDIPDGGTSPTSVNWTFLSASAQTGMRTTAVSVATVPAHRLYFGVTDFQSRSALVRVDNASANGPGVQITPPLTPGQGFPPYPSFVAVNPNDGNEIMAVFSNYNLESIWHSTNAGGTWANVEGNLAGEHGPSVRSAAIVPTQSGALYFVGTSTGIYSTATLNGAATAWAQDGAGVLGNVVVDMLVARPEDGVIVAGTHGRGVYRAQIGAGGAAAVALLDVSDLTINVRPEETGSAEFQISNAGTAPLTFNAGAVGKTGGPGGAMYRLQPLPTLREPVVRPHDIAGRKTDQLLLEAGRLAQGESHTTLLEGDVLILDDGDDEADDVLGWGDDVTPLQWGSRFFAPVGGYNLDGFYVYMRSEDQPSLPVEVYITDPDGNVFISGYVEFDASVDGYLGEWYGVGFDPIPLPEGQPFDIELITPAEIWYPAGVDYDGLVAGAGFFWVNSGLDGWYANLSSIEGYEVGAWLIRADGTAGGGSVNQPPTASINASRTRVKVAETVTFDGSASRDPDGTIINYLWSFGDGVVSSEAVTTHAYILPGTYNVTLTVTDNQMATGTGTVQITAISSNEPPTASIAISKLQAEVDEVLTFDGSASTDPDGTIASYSWSFGDGATSNQPVASHGYAQSGAYTARLTVTDNEGGTGEATVQVNVLAEASRLTVSPTNGTIQPGASRTITVTFDATGKAAGVYTGQVTMNTNGGNFTIPVAIVVDPSVAIEEEGELPGEFALEQNYPNPFNPRTVISFRLDRPSSVRLQVFDLNGRAVSTLVDGELPAGPHVVRWEGRDTNGYHVASGAYVYRLEAFSATDETVRRATRKMVLLK